jgi:short-subunit dehydrogenase
MFTYQGKTALITGASSGIGRAFAHALAQRGVSVVLVARSEERLRALATELSERHGIRTEVIPVDLSQEDTIRQIQLEVQQRGLVIDLLVNNAGFATNGYFETLSPERDHDQVMVDVTAVVDLTHAFVPALLERSPGAAIINVASTAGFQPLPYMAVYGASKAARAVLLAGLSRGVSHARPARARPLPRCNRDSLFRCRRRGGIVWPQAHARAGCRHRPARAGTGAQRHHR